MHIDSWVCSVKENFRVHSLITSNLYTTAIPMSLTFSVGPVSVDEARKTLVKQVSKMDEVFPYRKHVEALLESYADVGTPFTGRTSVLQHKSIIPAWHPKY